MMKTSSLLALLMMAFLTLFAGNLLITGCGDDDDDDTTGAVIDDDDDDDNDDNDDVVDDGEDLGCSDYTTEAECIAIAGCAWEFDDAGASVYPTATSEPGTCTQLETGGVISAADCALSADTGTFGGTVIGFVSRTGVPGLTVTLMDNETGEPVTGVDPQTTDASGNVSFAGIDKPDNCLIGIFVDGDDATTHDTYQWNLLYSNSAEIMWSVPEYLWQGGPAMAGIAQDAGKAVIAGGVYWMNDNNQEEFVGCSTVSTDDPDTDSAYMDATGMPAAPTAQPHVHPLVGFFLIGNIVPSTDAKITLTADVDGTDIGTSTIWAKPDTIHISNIYNIPRLSSNPTPDGCTE
jgi:hypothetical protein